MLFYDVSAGAWVRNPGSTSPPPMVPVLTIGGIFDVAVQFCCGDQTEGIGASAIQLGIKPKDDPAGDFIAHVETASQTSEGLFVFTVDLTTNEAKAYFDANPSELTQDAILMVGYTSDEMDRRTTPLEVVIQNDFLQTP